MVEETMKDVTIKYLYIEKFEWPDEEQREYYAGHPKVGEIYRSLQNNSTKHHRLLINQNNYFVLTPKDCNANKVHEINKKFLAQCKLSDAQLSKLSKWIDQDKKKVEMSAEMDQDMPQVKMISVEQFEEQQAVGISMELMKNLYYSNKDLFSLILEILSDLPSFDRTAHENKTVSLGLSEDGKGINIQQVMVHLDNYMGNIRKGGDDREDLIVSVLILLQELQRRIINNLDK